MFFGSFQTHGSSCFALVFRGGSASSLRILRPRLLWAARLLRGLRRIPGGGRSRRGWEKRAPQQFQVLGRRIEVDGLMIQHHHVVVVVVAAAAAAGVVVVVVVVVVVGGRPIEIT